MQSHERALNRRDELLFQQQEESIIHSSSRQAGRQVERLCEVFVEMDEEDGIRWYPWSVQITVTN